MTQGYGLRSFPLSVCLAIVVAGKVWSLPGPLFAQQEQGRFPEYRLPGKNRLFDPPGRAAGRNPDRSAACPRIAPLLRPDGGVSLETVYYGEVFTNARGGVSTRNATQYEGLLDLSLTFDFEKMQLALPGRFFMLTQNTHGRGLTDDFIGDTQVVSNIDSFDNIMQVSEYWWEFGLCDDRLAFRLGKQDLNTEFLKMDSADDFIQSSFGITPCATIPTYPDPSMGVVLLAALRESLRLKVGIWDVLADGESWGFSGNEVTFTIGELEYEFSLLDGRLPGVLDLGTAYVSGGRFSPSEYLPPCQAYYVQFEQLVFRESAFLEEDTQGLGVFISYTRRFSSGGFPTGRIWENFLAGLVYTGLIPSRKEDVIGAGVAWARLSQSGTNRETVVEWFYKARITPRMSLQPDIQYIATPSGVHRDALAVGLRFEVTL